MAREQSELSPAWKVFNQAWYEWDLKVRNLEFLISDSKIQLEYFKSLRDTASEWLKTHD